MAGIRKLGLRCRAEYRFFRRPRWSQWMDATLARGFLAGVSEPTVFLGRWFKRSATLSS